MVCNIIIDCVKVGMYGWMETGEKNVVLKHVGKGVIVKSKCVGWCKWQYHYNENVMLKFHLQCW